MAVGLMLFGLSCEIATAQDPLQPAVPKAATYDDLLAKLNSGDTKIDYKTLRLAYAERKDADPFGADHKQRMNMNAAVLEGRCKDALTLADKILKSTYLSPDAHIAESLCHRTLGDAARSDLHRSVYLGIINSILSEGDGRKPETAYIVITIEEEYAVAKALGITVWGESFERSAGHIFNVLRGTSTKNGRGVTLYFNVDIPLRIERARNAANSLQKQ